MNVKTELISSMLLGMDPLPANRQHWVVTITYVDGHRTTTGVSESCPDAETAAIAALRSRNYFGDKLKLIADIDVQRRYRSERTIMAAPVVPGSPLETVREKLNERSDSDTAERNDADSAEADDPSTSGTAGQAEGEAPRVDPE